MSFLKTCLSGIRPHDPNSKIASAYIPFISANYDHSEPFAYIIVAITGLLMIYNNYMLLKKYLFHVKQQFFWAFVFWGNFLFFFQLNLAITRYVNRLQLFIAIGHNMCELTMFYWIYLAIRNYVDCPFCTTLRKRVKVGDRAFLWAFTILAYTLNTVQIVITALFADLKYGTYVFYMIFFGDTLFIGGTIVCFIMVWRRRDKVSMSKLVGLLIAVIAHSLYAANNVLTCQYSTFTADIATVTYLISILAITWSVFTNRNHPNSIIDDTEYFEYLPSDTRFC